MRAGISRKILNYFVCGCETIYGVMDGYLAGGRSKHTSVCVTSWGEWIREAKTAISSNHRKDIAASLYRHDEPEFYNLGAAFNLYEWF